MILAYNSDPASKARIIAAMRADIAADRLVKGQYWEDGKDWEGGKGCAIGCLTRGSSREEAADLFGGPVELAGLFDAIFEGLPNSEAMAWPLDFLEAIPVGADLSLVWPKWAYWLLNDEVAKHAAIDGRCARAVADVAALFGAWIGGKKPPKEAWNKAAAGATMAARPAELAAGAFTVVGVAAMTAWTAGAAAVVVVAPVLAVAALIAGPMADAARAARAAARVARAAPAARAASYQRQAAKLLDLLRTAPVIAATQGEPA